MRRGLKVPTFKSPTHAQCMLRSSMCVEGCRRPVYIDAITATTSRAIRGTEEVEKHCGTNERHTLYDVMPPQDAKTSLLLSGPAEVVLPFLVGGLPI
ncbi:hypothetical protein EVAR_50740_1 [Eumeta japonica]|uniref:Uncharacterized protein n=1 Tax=Eumeta variegata TaxID=151549 RepID=A0A4C1Y142_EUMVA|nr:hypothetical protein EVAR_50740_1 [Eumeta japonica]